MSILEITLDATVGLILSVIGTIGLIIAYKHKNAAEKQNKLNESKIFYDLIYKRVDSKLTK